MRAVAAPPSLRPLTRRVESLASHRRAPLVVLLAAFVATAAWFAWQAGHVNSYIWLIDELWYVENAQGYWRLEGILPHVDGIRAGTMRVTWERQVPATAGGVPSYVALGEGPSLTPNTALVGLRLRAVATFTDGRGAQERVFSEVTHPVAAAPGPTPQPDPAPAPQPAPQPGLTANNPAQGSLLVASAGGNRYRVGTDGLTDPDGLGAMSFQWQFENGTGYVDLAGGGSQVLAVPDGLRGLRIRARVSYVDGRGHAESVLSPAVRVPTSRAGAPPVKKALSGKRGGRATAKVVWGDPAYSGGLRITGYQVTAVKVLRGGKSGARFTDTVGAGRRSLTMKLKKGKYRFQVRALNDLGPGRPGTSPVVRSR